MYKCKFSTHRRISIFYKHKYKCNYKQTYKYNKHTHKSRGNCKDGITIRYLVPEQVRLEIERNNYFKG